ncbi:MAG: hypothetical protein AB7S69_01120 [Salinivirgaceae bacterium]
MKQDSNSIEDLQAIRKLMEDSSRFLSLSGLSGVFAGLTAIAGALVAYFFILGKGGFHFENYLNNLPLHEFQKTSYLLLIDAAIVLLVSVLFALLFSVKKAKREGKLFLTRISKRLFVNLSIPLLTGGLFVVVLMVQNQIQLIIPSFLIFYGLALVNAGKFTFGEIFYLGILQIITGLVAAFIPGASLLFWMFGFGILHIIYGLLMYRKHEA